MKLGSATRDRLKLSSLVAAALGAVVLAWVLALLFSLPLTTGPVDRGAAEATVERRLGPDRIERAESFRAGQRKLAIGATALDLAVLLALALWRPAPLRRLIRFLGRRPLLGAAAAGAGISLLLALVGLPLDLAAVGRSRDQGLTTQSTAGWLADFALSTGITALIAAVGALAAMALWRRLRGRFWLAGSALAIAYAVIFVWLWPVVVSPLFNRFEPLPDGPVRAEVLRLADRTGVDVGEVLEVDASRRSSTLNAYVNGIGSTKRVVIYDNALHDLTRPELSALIAHELAHVESNDLERGLAFAILVIPLGVLTVQLAAGLLVGRAGDDPRGPGVVPALALAIAVVTMVMAVPGNWLSRKVEANADAEAIALTGPRGLTALQLRLAERNLADPDPPAAWQFLYGTHPTTIERVGMAAAREGGGS